ncbi:MAG TPA: RagB/SusD family nutrient uptake outer membrane protein [Longimicrobiales bacterium]
MMRTHARIAMALGLAAGLAGCMDLEVVDENAPDRERALSEPAEVEQVIVSTFRIWYNVLHGLADVAIPFPLLADEQTNTVTQRSVQWSREPRQPLINDPLADQVWVPRRPWDAFNECMASANDGLRQIKNGMRIRTLDPGATETQDNTDRAYVFAKLFQGICIGYLAITMDRFAVATEDTVIPTSHEAAIEWERTHLRPWQEGLPVAIRSLEEAIERAENGAPFLTPATWIPGQQYNNEQIAQLAHTMIARILIYAARTPAEREQVDWNKVLYHTERGLTYDWGPILQNGVITDPSYLARITNTGTSQMRADPHLLGPADQSGAYQAWLAKPREERNRFDIVTPDRRITGDTPTSNGAYFRYMSNNTGFDADRGTYNFSAYQWFRRLNYGNYTNTTGHFVLASADENRLFRAEALLRTGDLDGAAALINVTRTRGVKVGSTFTESNLPPVTAAGVPEVDGQCVPRTKEGACGTLLDALKWERQIELTGQNPMRAWHDFRGFGQLQPGTPLHMPVPARYLVQLNIPLYTFGGVGNPGSAE